MFIVYIFSNLKYDIYYMIIYLLYILIGIILYIINNNINGFSIGIPQYRFILVDGEIDETDIRRETSGTLAVKENPVYQDPDNPNIYFVYGDVNIYDARKNLKRYMELNQADVDIVNINVPTNVNNFNEVLGSETCDVNYGCSMVKLLNPENERCHSSCSQFSENDLENCQRYHTIDLCAQNCSFVNVKNPVKTLESDGFQKFSQLVDVDHTTQIQLSDEYNESGFLYTEYLFKMFIEKNNPDSNLHKITDGLYYINGKIILSRFSNGNLRISSVRTTPWSDLSPDQQRAANLLGWNENKWDINVIRDQIRTIPFSNFDRIRRNAITTLGWNAETWRPNEYEYYPAINPFQILHMDFQKFIPYDSIDNPYGNKDLIGRCVDGLNSKSHYINEFYNYGIQFISNNNSKSINLWLLLYGSPNIKTMGFIDIIDDDEHSKYNTDTLRDMQKNDLALQKDDSGNYSLVEFPGRLTPFFQEKSVQFPNVFEIQTSDDTRDNTKPNINPNILYTYDMIEGDVLAFRTDIPHVGFKDNDRVSVEFRYDYIELDLPLDQVFTFETYKNKNKNECAADANTILLIMINLDVIKELLTNFTDYNFTEILHKISLYFKNIFRTLKKKYKEKFNKELQDESLFLRFLISLDSKPTLNFNKMNNNYDSNNDRLVTYIQEFLDQL